MHNLEHPGKYYKAGNPKFNRSLSNDSFIPSPE